MAGHPIFTIVEVRIAPTLEKLPLVSRYATTRGWPFVMSWCHRISGLAMVAFVWLHIYTVSSLTNPAAYDAKMRIFKFPVLTFLEWALAIPVIFHALNGGRLILYEGFGARDDGGMIRWVWGLSFLYVAVTAVLMLKGNQDVTPGFFWFIVLVAGLTMAYRVARQAWESARAIPWKLQRITGGFLLAMVPAHLMFMHLNLAVGHDASVVVARMQSAFINLVDLTLLLGLLFHAGYGLVSIASDYVPFRAARWTLAAIVAGVMAGFAWMGAKVLFLV